MNDNEIFKLKNDILLCVKKEGLSESQFDELMAFKIQLLDEEKRRELVNEIKEALVPFWDFCFLRDMSEERQREVLQYMFTHYALENDEISCDEIGVTDKDLASLQKLFNTIQRMAIVNNYSNNRFRKELEETFAFCNAVSDYLYDLYSVNKKELRILFVLNRISSLSDETRQVYGMFKRILQSIQDDEEQENNNEQ